MPEQTGWETIGKLAIGGLVGAVVGFFMIWAFDKMRIAPEWTTVIVGFLAGAAISYCFLT